MANFSFLNAFRRRSIVYTRLQACKNKCIIIYEYHNVFPEYFFISIPSFNNIINHELDEWLYVMKHADVRDDFKSPYMKKVVDRLSILKMSKEERKAYYYYLKESIQVQDTLTSARIEGEQLGIEKGKMEGKQAERYVTAVKMLSLNMGIEIIQAVANFTKEEIEAISKENKNSLCA